MTPAPDDVGRSVLAWLNALEECVQTRDFERARALFDEHVASFGSRVAALRGLGALEQEQWRVIWPSVEDYRYERETLELFTAGELACLAVRFSSRGFRLGGARYERPGRATFVLRAAETPHRWLAVHTHFSLVPGVPNTTPQSP